MWSAAWRADGVTCGAPLCALIENTNARSGDYDSLKNRPRPSHADYTAFVKYQGFADARGGGHFSGRLTAPLCFAGAVALQILARRGVTVGARIAEIAGVCDGPAEEEALFLSAREKEFPVADDDRGAQMREAIAAAKREGDSVGGVVEARAYGLPAGLGEPMFGGMENEFANAFRDGDTLKSIRWSQSGSNYDDCFHFDLEETDGAYTVSGWCIDTEGSRERVERIDAPLTPEQWAEVPAGELASAAHGLAGGDAGP